VPFHDPWLHKGQDSPLERERRLYAHTRNPIHVWRALQICSEQRDEDRSAVLPAWIVDYLDTFTGVIQEWFNERDGDDTGLADHLTAALGFKPAGRGVRDTAFAAWDQAHRDEHLVIEIRRQSRAQPEVSKADIMADLAERLQVSESTLWRAWRARRVFFE